MRVRAVVAPVLGQVNELMLVVREECLKNPELRQRLFQVRTPLLACTPS
jgi:hypothetical protein